MRNVMSVLLLIFIVVPVTAQDTTRLSLLFAGDVMGHDSQIAAAYDQARKDYDYEDCFARIKPYIQSADVAIANLEVTLAGPPYKGYPQFSSPDALALTLKSAGFDALVTANNHCVDRGRKGLERTVMMLDSLKIPHTGTFVDSADRQKNYPLILHKNGFTLALLNYTYGTNGLPVYQPSIVNRIDTTQIRKDLAKAKEQKPDIIIVFTHWGVEYQSLPNGAQKDVANFCLNKGANLVIGAHPHVIQPMEWYKDQNQFVAYSLGNFVSGQRKRYTDGGAMAYLEFSKVIFNNDSTVTTLDSTGYYLQWIYKSGKKYYIVPVQEDEAPSFVKDQVAREAYRQFVADSHTLYKKYNKHVSEISGTPADSVVRYRVVLMKTDSNEDPWKLLTSPHHYTWGIDRDVDEDGKILWLTGNFETREKADQYALRYLTQHKDAHVVKYVNGRKVND